jgi:hypothetical protein
MLCVLVSVMSFRLSQNFGLQLMLVGDPWSYPLCCAAERKFSKLSAKERVYEVQSRAHLSKGYKYLMHRGPMYSLLVSLSHPLFTFLAAC